MSVRNLTFILDTYREDCLLHGLGLFAPRAGQQSRDERRRRSQFDRGTAAAEREIVYVRTYSPQRYHGIGNGFGNTYPAMGGWYDHHGDISETGSGTS